MPPPRRYSTERTSCSPRLPQPCRNAPGSKGKLKKWLFVGFSLGFDWLLVGFLLVLVDFLSFFPGFDLLWLFWLVVFGVLWCFGLLL